MKMLCSQKIELAGNGVVVTYCVLPFNHEGQCKPDELLVLRYKQEDKKKGE